MLSGGGNYSFSHVQGHSVFALPSRDNCSNALRNMPESIATADILHRGSL